MGSWKGQLLVLPHHGTLAVWLGHFGLANVKMQHGLLATGFREPHFETASLAQFSPGGTPLSCVVSPESSNQCSPACGRLLKISKWTSMRFAMSWFVCTRCAGHAHLCITSHLRHLSETQTFLPEKDAVRFRSFGLSHVMLL